MKHFGTDSRLKKVTERSDQTTTEIMDCKLIAHFSNEI